MQKHRSRSHGVERRPRSAFGRFRVSLNRWHVAKRCTYLLVLGISALIFYLLWSLDEALDMLAP